jgi:RNase H-fold protein (predicted Holliday junction resolvase)
MPLINLEALPPGRLLGIDPGARRIGVALSDVNRRAMSVISAAFCARRAGRGRARW